MKNWICWQGRFIFFEKCKVDKWVCRLNKVNFLIVEMKRCMCNYSISFCSIWQYVLKEHNFNTQYNWKLFGHNVHWPGWGYLCSPLHTAVHISSLCAFWHCHPYILLHFWKMFFILVKVVMVTSRFQCYILANWMATVPHLHTVNSEIWKHDKDEKMKKIEVGDCVRSMLHYFLGIYRKLM